MRLEEFPNWLEIQLNTGDGVLQLKVVEHFWMENTNRSNFLSRENDICTSLREELRILVVSMRLQGEIFMHNSANLGHHLAQAAMDNLE